MKKTILLFLSNIFLIALFIVSILKTSLSMENINENVSDNIYFNTALFESRMIVRNYSKELSYEVILNNQIFGKSSLILEKGSKNSYSEKRLEDFYPQILNLAITELPRYYSLTVKCEYDHPFIFTHERDFVEMHTLIALFEPKPCYRIDQNYSSTSYKKLGMPSYLLPELSVSGEKFRKYECLPNYNVFFNSDSTQEAKKANDAMICLVSTIIKDMHELEKKRFGDVNFPSKTTLAGYLYCYSSYLFKNGYIREDQGYDALEQIFGVEYLKSDRYINF
jgi:hypothetical protein